jgi:hypothetical protein
MDSPFVLQQDYVDKSITSAVENPAYIGEWSRDATYMWYRALKFGEKPHQNQGDSRFSISFQNR